MLRRILLILSLAVFVARAPAQYVGPFVAPGVGVGVGIGPSVGFGVYPRSIYGGFGYFPSQYNGFYTNGFSAYGPPVPTYGIVPGTFGANDYRLNNNINIQNGADIGLGGSGAGGAGPRRRHWQIGGDTSTQQINQASGYLEVRLPVPDAEVSFEGQPVQGSGNVRRITSPAIAQGVAHFYSIRAKWKRDGEAMERSLGVSVRAGQLTVVDFTIFDRGRGPALTDGKPD